MIRTCTRCNITFDPGLFVRCPKCGLRVCLPSPAPPKP